MDFETFTLNYFQGDKEKALEHLSKESYYSNYTLTKTKKNLQTILDTLDESLAERFMDYFSIEVERNPQIMKKEINEIGNLINLNLSYDEIKNAEVNPYKAKLGKSFLKLLIGGSGLIAFAVIAQSLGQTGLINNVGSGLTTLFGAYISYDIGVNLLNYFRFKKAKNHLDRVEMLNNGIVEKEVKTL